jgi:hypothetical protein
MKELETFEQRVEKKRLEMSKSESESSRSLVKTDQIELQSMENLEEEDEEELEIPKTEPKSENRKSAKKIGDLTSDMTTSDDIDEEDWKELKSLLLKIKISRFFVTDFFKVLMIANTFFVRIILFTKGLHLHPCWISGYCRTLLSGWWM